MDTWKHVFIMTYISEDIMMGFTDWLGLEMKKNKEVSVEKVKTESIDMGAMAAGSPSEAATALSRMLAQRNSLAKVLVVQDGVYTVQVTEYAIKMAQRLDCEIIALDVSDKPLQFCGERKIRESDHFIETARKNGAQFVLQAKNKGVTAKHVMDIGKPEEIIARIRETDAGIRYILSRPKNLKVGRETDNDPVPIFSLRCVRI